MFKTIAILIICNIYRDVAIFGGFRLSMTFLLFFHISRLRYYLWIIYPIPLDYKIKYFFLFWGSPMPPEPSRTPSPSP